MAVLDWNAISGIIVDVILFFIVAGNAVLGYRRGLTGVIFSIFSTIIAFVLVLILYKPVTNYIFNNTQLSQNIENTIENKIGSLFEKENIQTTDELEKNDSMSSILKIFIGDEIGNAIEETANALTQYLSNRITQKIISVVVFFALFAIMRLILYVLKNYISLVANLPIVRIFDGSGGMIYGIIKGFLIIYAIFAIISIMMPVINHTGIVETIQHAKIGGNMFNNNIILGLIFKFI